MILMNRVTILNENKKIFGHRMIWIPDPPTDSKIIEMGKFLLPILYKLPFSFHQGCL
jgi:hypothetical protein